MTDSMKFGPEWLRNMSAEPSGSPSTYNVSTGGPNSSIAVHNLGNNTTASASRNLFPEYRYGREEMLSLFDRNCMLPQILPSFKKLFVEKVQYPLALTPSSEIWSGMVAQYVSRAIGLSQYLQRQYWRPK